MHNDVRPTHRRVSQCRPKTRDEVDRSPPLPHLTSMPSPRAHRTLTVALAAARVFGAVAILILAYAAEC